VQNKEPGITANLVAIDQCWSLIDIDIRPKWKYCCHQLPSQGMVYESHMGGRLTSTRTNLDFTEARDSEWQWHQLGHMPNLHLT